MGAESDGFFFTSALTDAAGNYISEGGTATGTVYVATRNALGYRDEVYNNIHCLDCEIDSGTPVGVTLGLTTSNINFALDTGGHIAGNVTATGGAPLANVDINIHNSSGTFVTSIGTDGSGNYLSAGLPAGTYYARTWNEQRYVDKLYNNLACTLSNCNVTTGTAITVTAAGGAPIQNVNVRIHNASGTQVGSINTNSSGTYLTSGLPHRTHTVRR